MVAHWILSPARLPVPPLSLFFMLAIIKFIFNYKKSNVMYKVIENFLIFPVARGLSDNCHSEALAEESRFITH